MTHQDEAAGAVDTLTASDCLMWKETAGLQGDSLMVTGGDEYMTGLGQLP